MNKSEIREVTKLAQYRALGADTGMIARGLSALIRAARTNKSRNALMEYAPIFGVMSHPDFIV
jgi:hypothetical protein